MAQLLILNFHGIGEPHPDVDSSERPYWLALAELKRILDRVVELRGGAAPALLRPTVKITFDDGNRSDVDLALGELTARHLKAKFFVCANRLGARHYLDRADLKTLLAEGMEVGSHGFNHRDLRTLEPGSLSGDIAAASGILSKATGTRITEFAVPFGGYNRQIIAALKANGIERIYTSDRGLAEDDQPLLPRETLTTGMASLRLPDDLMVSSSITLRLRRAAARAYKTWM